MLINCLAAYAHLTITVSEIQRDIGRKSSIFYTLLTFDAPVRGVPVGIAPPDPVCIASHGKKSLHPLGASIPATSSNVMLNLMPSFCICCSSRHTRIFTVSAWPKTANVEIVVRSMVRSTIFGEATSMRLVRHEIFYLFNIK